MRSMAFHRAVVIGPTVEDESSARGWLAGAPPREGGMCGFGPRRVAHCVTSRTGGGAPGGPRRSETPNIHPPPMTWNPTQLPEQHGRNILITGSNAGPGYFAAEQLDATGAHIIVASRQSPVASRQSPVASRQLHSAKGGCCARIHSATGAVCRARVVAARPRYPRVNTGPCDRRARMNAAKRALRGRHVLLRRGGSSNQ